MPSIRLLDLTNLVALSPSKHFFNGLSKVTPTATGGRDSEENPGSRSCRESIDESEVTRPTILAGLIEMPTGDRPTIIIPVYRARRDVHECLVSLRSSGDLAAAAVLVVDDFSDDGTAEMVERDFPEVTVVRRGTNGGFARTVNTGMTRVSAASRFVALLNSDTIVENGWLQAGIDAMERDDSVGAVAPRIVLHEDPATLDSAGQGYTIAGWAYRRGHGSRFGPPFDEATAVFGTTGCAAIFRRRALDEQPSVFRDDFACYYEDTDLAFRLQRAGWRCLYVPGSVVRHKLSRSYG